MIVSVPPADTAWGYYIDLNTNILKLRTERALLARLESIEHVEGTITDDEIIGNSENNVLNGGGGKDYLSGLDGDDTLILEDGSARGGAWQ